MLCPKRQFVFKMVYLKECAGSEIFFVSVLSLDWFCTLTYRNTNYHVIFTFLFLNRMHALWNANPDAPAKFIPDPLRTFPEWWLRQWQLLCNIRYTPGSSTFRTLFSYQRWARYRYATWAMVRYRYTTWAMVRYRYATWAMARYRYATWAMARYRYATWAMARYHYATWAIMKISQKYPHRSFLQRISSEMPRFPVVCYHFYYYMVM